MSFSTTSQRAYALSVEKVNHVAAKPEPVRQIYGGLCHEFPVMLRSSGLAQTAAYHHAKGASGGHRGEAHDLILAHMGALIGVDDLVEFARTSPTSSYLIATRQLLDGAVFFKRLAVSILGASPDSGRE